MPSTVERTMPGAASRRNAFSELTPALVMYYRAHRVARGIWLSAAAALAGRLAHARKDGGERVPERVGPLATFGLRS